jgi:hypothetical protein
MDVFFVKEENGDVTEVPCCQFTISPFKDIMVMGTEFNDRASMQVNSTGHMDTRLAGKLEEQAQTVQVAIVEALAKIHWDFKVYPNPEIIIITDKRFSNAY